MIYTVDLFYDDQTCIKNKFSYLKFSCMLSSCSAYCEICHIVGDATSESAEATNGVYPCSSISVCDITSKSILHNFSKVV